MSFFYGYENKNNIETIGGLPTTGGEMTGDINMNDNHIITSVDPIENSHLARKKYVDDKVSSNTASGNFLLKTGGSMTGDINMQDNKILSSTDPTDDTHLTRKKYVDTEDAKKLSKTGGIMTGDITIGNNKIVTTSNPTADTHLSRKKYIDDNLKILKKDVGFSILRDNFSKISQFIPCRI